MKKAVNKVTKLSRYARYRYFRRSGIPIFWHIGKPNFGDDLNPWLFSQIAETQTRFVQDRSKPHFLGMGSILDRITNNSIVLGSGLLAADLFHAADGAKFVAVRGDLTAEACGLGKEILRGDPMVLIDQFLPKPVAHIHKLSIVPHVTEYDAIVRRLGKKYHVINPSAPPKQVISEIGASARVASQSLHGLITADAYGVPNVWIEPSHQMKGGSFKFHDYFTTIDKPKKAISLVDFCAASIDELPFEFGNYIYEKQELMVAIRSSLVASISKN